MTSWPTPVKVNAKYGPNFQSLPTSIDKDELFAHEFWPLVAPPRKNVPVVGFYPSWMPEVMKASCLQPSSEWIPANDAWMQLPGPIIGYVRAGDDAELTVPVKESMSTPVEELAHAPDNPQGGGEETTLSENKEAEVSATGQGETTVTVTETEEKKSSTIQID